MARVAGWYSRCVFPRDGEPGSWDEDSDASLERTLDGVTVRMASVLRFVAEGYTQAEIAERSGVPRATVRDYIRQLEGLTECADMRELGRWWLEHRDEWTAHIAARAGTERPVTPPTVGVRRRPILRRVGKGVRRTRPHRPRLRVAADVARRPGAARRHRPRLARVALVAALLLAVPLAVLAVATAIGYGDSYDQAAGGPAVSASDAPSAATAEAAPRDTLLTFAEHEQAVLRTAACLEAAGHTRVSLIPGKGLRTSKIRSSISVPDGADPGATVRAAQGVSMDCRRQYLDAANEAWQAQLDRDPVKVERAFDALEACVEAGGPAETVPTGGGYAYARSRDLPSRDVVVGVRDVETYGQCALEFEAETGFLAPPPGVVSERPVPGSPVAQPIVINTDWS